MGIVQTNLYHKVLLFLSPLFRLFLLPLLLSTAFVSACVGLLAAVLRALLASFLNARFPFRILLVGASANTVFPFLHTLLTSASCVCVEPEFGVGGVSIKEFF